MTHKEELIHNMDYGYYHIGYVRERLNSFNPKVDRVLAIVQQLILQHQKELEQQEDVEWATNGF